MFNVRIESTGSYIPSLKLTNNDLAGIVETNDEWIRTRSGIETRNYTSGEPTWYMGVEAARAALGDVDPESVGMIVVSTVTPDYMTPATASIIQAEIGAKNAFCFDLNAGCTGFVYALDIAARYLASASFDYALVVAAEILTKQTDFTDRATCVLFGDGAGAVLLRKSKDGESSAFTGAFHGGEYDTAGLLVGKAFQVDHPFLPEEKFPERFPEHTGGINFSMQGREVYKFAVEALPKAVENAASEAGWSVGDIDLIVPHQANARIVQAAARRLCVDDSVMVDRIADLGNTSSATVPIVLDQLMKEGKLERGMKLVVAGFGGGLCYGAVALIY
jgi:3-oxoacyl-[acyl-carrier-protein] synthase-3